MHESFVLLHDAFTSAVFAFFGTQQVWHLQRSYFSDIERKERIFISVGIRRHRWKCDILTNTVLLKICEYGFVAFLHEIYHKVISYSASIYTVLCSSRFRNNVLFYK